MTGSGTLTFSGTLTGFQFGSRTINAGMALSAAIDDSIQPTLIQGDNTIPVPSGATGCIIFPPPGNAVVLKLKGAGGDTGVALHKTQFSILNLDLTQVSFIINAASVLTGPLQIDFY